MEAVQVLGEMDSNRTPPILGGSTYPVVEMEVRGSNRVKVLQVLGAGQTSS